MINEGILERLGLEPIEYETGYYSITNTISVDVEGNIRVDCDFSTWIGEVHNAEELKELIKIVRR